MKSAIAALVCVFVCVPALAHDHSRPELDGWFKGLRSKGWTPCCDGSDQQGLADPDWDIKDGKYRVRLKGEWHDVPDDAIVDGPNKAGHAMVWPVEYADGSLHVRCFMPGTGA